MTTIKGELSATQLQYLCRLVEKVLRDKLEGGTEDSLEDFMEQVDILQKLQAM